MFSCKHNPGKKWKGRTWPGTKGSRVLGHLQMDLVWFPPFLRFEHVSVTTCLFSSRVEAFHWWKALVLAVTRSCLTCVSNLSTHILGTIITTTYGKFPLFKNLCCPYCPRYSGKVERTNGILNLKLAKLYETL